MTKFIIATLFLFGLISCQDSKTADSITTDESRGIKLPIKKITDTWTEVEYKDGNWIIFQPCDDEIFKINISEQNGRGLINIGWGQEQETAYINSVLQTNDSTVLVDARDTSNSYNISLSFKRTGDKTQFQIAYPGTDNRHKKYLIKTDDVKNFRKVKQPCRECWDDEICDSLERTNNWP